MTAWEFWTSGLTAHRARLIVRALLAEFFGTLFLQVVSALTASNPLASGLAYAGLVYATIGTSGGHLNPVITLSLLLTGFFEPITTVLYISFQILGALTGSIVEILLVPGLKWHVNPGELGCFVQTGLGLNNYQILAWEFLFTLFLLWVVYATAIIKPELGTMAPLAYGIVVFLASVAGLKQWGHVLPLNPARVLGTGAAFNCSFRRFWILLLAEVLACFAASAAAALVDIKGFYWGNWVGVRQVVWVGIRQPRAPGAAQGAASSAPRVNNMADLGLREPLMNPTADVAAGDAPVV